MSVNAHRDVESAVRERYSAAARAPAGDLCCPVEYDPRHLEVIPQEVIERDYGCGNPSRYVGPGETVLDLGSGAGKSCFIAAQVVGPRGRVIGVDVNADMLAVARRAQSAVADALGFDNVTFRRGRIQDLQLDLDRLEGHLHKRPITSGDSWLEAEAVAERLRVEAPLVASESVDVVISNCVLNLVRPDQKRRLFEEMYRVLRDGPEAGGRAVISDIVSDEEVPAALQADPKLWTGCISGALREDRFLAAFTEAGFHGVRILERQAEPWATVQGIEFRSVTVAAFKGKSGPCVERRQAVIYRGPWKEVVDDDGHVLRRGERMAVCDKTFRLYLRADGPYAGEVLAVPPHEPPPLEEAGAFDCARPQNRHPRETKGQDFDLTQLPTASACAPGECC